MIKLLREAAHDYPWFLKSIMGILALAFVITMGWWGFGQEGGNVVASVGDQIVPLDEYRRAYENTYRFYKDKGQNDIKDEFLKQFVLEQLIDNRMWLHVAKEMGLDGLRRRLAQSDHATHGVPKERQFRSRGLSPIAGGKSFDPRIFRGHGSQGYSHQQSAAGHHGCGGPHAVGIFRGAGPRLSSKETQIRPKPLQPRSGFSRASCFRNSNGR